MANPQLENGHIRIANDLWEVIFASDLTGAELHVLGAIIRCTWGWQKKEAAIPQMELTRLSGVQGRARLSHITRRLQERGIITKQTAHGNITVYAMNKDYDAWQTIARGDSTAHKDSTIHTDKTVLSPRAIVHDNIKQIKTRYLPSEQQRQPIIKAYQQYDPNGAEVQQTDVLKLAETYPPEAVAGCLLDLVTSGFRPNRLMALLRKRLRDAQEQGTLSDYITLGKNNGGHKPSESETPVWKKLELQDKAEAERRKAKSGG